MPLLFDPDQTIVITDFDETLTLPQANGETVSLMSILRARDYLSPTVTKKLYQHRSYYHPLEKNPQMSRLEKVPLMEEWFQKVFQTLGKGGLTQTMIEQVARDPVIELRPQAAAFLRLMAEQHIPVIICSASGLGGNAIPVFLRDRGLLTDNITIVSNQLIFDKHGHFQKAAQPLVTSVNKNGKIFLDYGFYQKNSKKECLLLGDSLDDVNMADGLCFDKLLKIAFTDKDHAIYNQVYDLVLDYHADFSLILNLFQS